jgi:apolipoprotein D and lipocalin family protein
MPISLWTGEGCLVAVRGIVMRNVAYLALLGLAACATGQSPPRTVPHVDLQRYAGVWHEVARYPNRFEDGGKLRCVDVTATYMLRPDGKITVRNACRDLGKGKTRLSEGWARVADPSGARLRVTFFWPFFGDYWVIGLDPDYRWAVVGTPDRRYLWVLSRTPTLPQDIFVRATATAAAQGFDLGPLVRTPPQL